MKGEYDVVLTNTHSILVVEVKYKLTCEYVTNFYKKSLPKFKLLFPEYSGHKIYGAVASYSDEDNARELAAKYGLFVLGREGQSYEIINKHARQVL
ncbi:MAG: hypothetical protein OMM_07648 [Candidatus Magnetoglobus multicellularis str. Araruama]|uniref:Uncharacterized protein n=1 Tax=Candidatus Magnetoglobus multicellularis str. Araruama TaxID=890399 RepID=A0A1V1PBN2_9BACT|nr:MAG: hypothetical protein OMM_07648 [Candidatus Magnetoglobus multicellularis str. Araruama]